MNLRSKAPIRTMVFAFTALFVYCTIPSGVCVSATPQPGTRRPHIVLIMADDLGWTDLACQGNERLETPCIDRLADQGMRFTDAYAAAPVCSPTRAAVLTGLAPARLQITNHIPDQERFTPPDSKWLPAKMLDHLPTHHVTIAERLSDAGYATAFFGKWHLAGKAGYQGQGDLAFYPERQGFASNLGGTAMGGPFSFFDPYRLHNLPDRKTGEYMPDRFADEVVQFMRAHVAAQDEQPFFVCLWNYTVHWPMEAPEPLVKKYQARESQLDGIDPRYAAMIEAYDASVGRIVHEIDQLQLSDQTLVIFTSDNGAFDGVSDLRPLRAAKGYLYEGGVRVPLIVRWSGQVPAGSVDRTPVISMDFFPTLLEAAGLSPATKSEAPMDGVSLLPVLTRSGELDRDSIYFHYPNFAFHRQNRLGGAVRNGDWKLIEYFDDQSVELYNLAEDLGEQEDLSETQPQIARRLVGQLQQWRTEVGAVMPTPRTE